jgi:DNA (cytosine-5)-methyltransferase 1
MGVPPSGSGHSVCDPSRKRLGHSASVPNAFRYLSVCSGIEAATVAWHPLGWEAAAFSEIEAFPRAVLAHHYPETPCHGDFTTIEGDEYGPVELLVGGTPCQSFSVAGLRGGMDDERGQLALQFLKLLDRTRARWVVWENVPGVLSSNGGRDFGSFLGGLVELGYGFAYRVLDAQHFGVPQRRRRVFVVGHSGDWRRAAAVLFERHSLSGNPAPRREKGEAVANAITERPDRGGGNSEGQRLIPSTGDISHCLNAGGMGRQVYETETLIAQAFDLRGREGGSQLEGPHNTANICAASGGSSKSYIAFTAKDHGADASDISPTLRSGSHSGSHANGGVMPAVAFNITPSNSNKDYNARQTERSQAITGAGNKPSARGGDLIVGSAVRRLTPRECERLQGFPDDYTLVPYRGKPAADGPRYKALGNSMAVPVMRWIGERIAQVAALSILNAEKAA